MPWHQKELPTLKGNDVPKTLRLHTWWLVCHACSMNSVRGIAVHGGQAKVFKPQRPRRHVVSSCTIQPTAPQPAQPITPALAAGLSCVGTLAVVVVVDIGKRLAGVEGVVTTHETTLIKLTTDMTKLTADVAQLTADMGELKDTLLKVLAKMQPQL